ncbi:MAG: creatininase family protein [Alphaproteobacteria bacterium]
MNANKKTSILKQDKISHGDMLKLDREKTIVIATLSPIEVHGPHLPLGQDIYEAAALAEHTAEKVIATHPDWTCLLLHPVPVAVDCVPQLGSINYPARLVREVAYWTLRPFAAHGFARMAFSSFHGGPRHITALETAAQQLRDEFGAAAVSLFSAALARVAEGSVHFEAIKDLPECEITLEQLRLDHHAGFLETSFALHLWPELVDEGWDELPVSVAEEENPEREANSSYLFDYAKRAQALDGLKRIYWTASAMSRAVKHFQQNTYHGYPAMSSAEQGRRMFENLVDICAEVVEEFLAKGREMDGHSPLWKYRRLILNPALNKVLEDWLKLYSE